MRLDELLAQNPEAKEDYELQISCLNKLGVNIIEEQNRYIDRLEALIIENADRVELLKVIDDRYWYTARLQECGELEEDEHWYDQYLGEENEHRQR